MLPPRIRRAFAHPQRCLRPTLEPLEQRVVLNGDSDDTLAEAIPTTQGGLVSPITLDGRINELLDVDMFKFVVEKGTTVDIDVDITGDDLDELAFNPELLVFSPQGLLIKHVGSAAAPGETPNNLEPYYRFVSPYEGTFYVGISVWPNITYNPITGVDIQYTEGSGTGDYSLTLTPESSTDPDDQIAEAVSLGSLTKAKRKEGELGSNTDVDLYSFSVGAKRWITFDLDRLGSSSLDAHLRIFDKAGFELLSSKRDTHAINESTNIRGEAYLEYQFAKAGTYYLGVSTFSNQDYLPVQGGRDNASNTTGAFSLLISPIELWADSNDTLSEATNLGSASRARKAAGVIEGSFDVDMYKVSIKANQYLMLDLKFAPRKTSRAVIHSMKIFNERGAQVRHSEYVLKSPITLSHRFATAGTYYVAISSYANDRFNANNGFGDKGDTGYVKSRWLGDYELSVGPAVARPRKSVR